MAISLHELFNRRDTPGYDIRSFRHFLRTLSGVLPPFGPTISVREIHRLLPFPENAVEVMPEYIAPTLLDILPAVAAALNEEGVIIEHRPRQHEVNQDRKALRAFLHDPNFQQDFLEKEPSGRRLLHELYFAMRSRQRYEEALGLLNKLSPVGGTYFNASATRDEEGPFWREDIRLSKGVVVEDPVVRPHARSVVILRGYRGPDLDWVQRRQLDDVRDFTLATDPEHRFRLGLLRGDIHVGLRQFETAIQEYDTIRRDVVRSRRKFLAIRSGFAHLARGDQWYRSTRDLSSDAVTAARAHYQAAVQVVQDHEVSEENHFHQTIKEYANKRLTQLSNPLNYLGYSNTYVPAGPAFGGLNDNDSMFGLAMTRVRAAQQVRGAFVEYLKAAGDTHRAAAEAAHAIREAEAGIRIAAERRTQAGLRRDAAAARLESVKSKNGWFKLATFRDLLVAAATTAAAAAAVIASGPAAGVVIAAGAGSFAVKTWAGLEELDVEEKLAGFDLRVAESEVRIAELEVSLAESQKRFLEEQKALLVQGAALNLEVYYALAREYERLIEAHMEAAIKLAFFAERRATFERGDPNLPQVDLEYCKPATDLGVGGQIIAPDFLEQDLLRLNEAFQQGGQVRTDCDLQISLRNDYPIEFSAFQHSGILPFNISLYDLERFRPGTSDQRIETLRINIVGLGDALPNISGRLRHAGTFMVRDRASAADAERLLPTPEELADALALFQQGRTSTVTTKGVTLWQVDPREKELTNLEDDPDIEEFRDYGLTGLWELEMLPRENPDIDLHNITDIVITINGRTNQGDPGFRAHIRELVKKYEQEQQPAGQDDAPDRTAALSMQQSFLSDAFAALLATGAATFPLQAATFPDPTIADTKVKTVLWQAIDAEGKGVEGVRLRVSKEGAADAFDRTTRANGFSEDLDADLPFLEPARRFAMEGRWRIDAADRARLARVNDLIVFFIYALPEGAGDE
jgi:Tc toxin complex TcA C-terminal TcB-binding domain